jgi:hypothetical protein
LHEPLLPERIDETIDYEIGGNEVNRWGLAPTGDFPIV